MGKGNEEMSEQKKNCMIYDEGGMEMLIEIIFIVFQFLDASLLS